MTLDVRANGTLSNQLALEVFMRGFSSTRSFIKPYLIHAVSEAVWMLADPPGGRIPARTSEFVTYGVDSKRVLEAVERQPTERHTLCVLIDSPADLQETVATYKARGYRYAGREPMFALDTGQRVSVTTYPVRRVVLPEGAAAIARAARSRQILDEHLGDGDRVCRLFAAFDGGAPIGWVRSIRTHPECAWVSNMYVKPEYRRRGIGRSLLSAMLDDDARYGIRWSVLLASLTGALLYPHLGYREQGLLLIFSPARAK